MILNHVLLYINPVSYDHATYALTLADFNNLRQAVVLFHIR
jgi:hypothetical protein